MCDLNVMAAHYSRITLQNMYIKLIMDPFDHLRWCLGFSVFRCVEHSTPRTFGFRILLLYRCEVTQVKDVMWQNIVAVSISQRRQQP
jgi:hypothetical protein